MQEFEGKVAVVTGAASGIGRALAMRFAEAGCSVVLADIELEALSIAAAEVEALGASVLAVPTDTSTAEALDALADRAFERFGAVHILCNNAGVSGQETKVWEATAADWEWIVGVNLFGVAHGIRAFVPRMIEQDAEGHIVNTSSVLGIASGGGPAIYGATKHAVARISEGLHHQLREIDSKLRVSVLCPGMIATQITSADRNRPARWQNEEPSEQAEARRQQSLESTRRFLADGMPPEEVAEMVFEAIRDERFYILTHPAIKTNVRMRMEDILEERTPEAAPLSL